MGESSKRSAHATIRGYLYQTCLGVQRWLDLQPNEILVCEGDEDLDRHVLEGVSIFEQVKDYSSELGAAERRFNFTITTQTKSRNIYEDSAPLKAVEWSFDKPDLNKIRDDIQNRLAHTKTSRDLPSHALLDRLIAEVLDASGGKDIRDRIFTPQRLLTIVENVRRDLEAGQSTPTSDRVSNLLQLGQKAPVATESSSIWLVDTEREMLQFFQAHPEEMRSMPPRDFEKLIAAVFKSEGFSVRLTPQTRDKGVDIIAVEHSALTGKNTYLIECKRQKGNVGIAVAQRLLGVVSQMQAAKGIVVTTSYFTRSAKEVAWDTNQKVTLRDYDALRTWLGC